MGVYYLLANATRKQYVQFGKWSGIKIAEIRANCGYAVVDIISAWSGDNIAFVADEYNNVDGFPSYDIIKTQWEDMSDTFSGSFFDNDLHRMELVAHGAVLWKEKMREYLKNKPQAIIGNDSGEWIINGVDALIKEVK